MILTGTHGTRPRVHFSGIGGTGMVAAARLAIDAGWEVRGSDNPLYPPASGMAEALGVPVADCYAPENLEWQPDVVVIGNALSRGNPEIEAALERGLPYTSFPEWLRDAVLRTRKPVVVTGTHGKTTTSALTAFLLSLQAADTGYFIGGQCFDFPHPARLGGEGAPFVIEGDEYDSAFFDKRSKFFHYLPHFAVVTGIEFDHADIFENTAQIERAFQLMLRQIPRTGTVLLCSDSERALALREHAPCNVVTYGFAERADWRVVEDGHEGPYHRFRLITTDGRDLAARSPLHGPHNLANAAAAIAMTDIAGGDAKIAARDIERFRGVRRRMEVFLEARGATFIDDFAHHPTAIRATIAAVRKRWQPRRLIVLFEPRSNTTATNVFQAELGQAFGDADEVWIGPIYRADRYAAGQRLDRDRLIAEITGTGPAAYHTDDTREIVDSLDAAVAEADVVLILSNGAFAGIYDALKTCFGAAPAPAN